MSTDFMEENQLETTVVSRIPFGLVIPCILVILSLAAGWLLNTSFGLRGEVSLSEGSIINAVPIRGEDLEAELGFTLLLERAVVDYGPLDIRLAVLDFLTGWEIDRLEIQESKPPVNVAGSELKIAFERYDDDAGTLFLRAEDDRTSSRFTFSLTDMSPNRFRFNEAELVLLAHKFPRTDPAIRARVSVLKDKDVRFTEWLQTGQIIRWKGMRIICTGSEVGSGGIVSINLVIENRPGRPLYGLALFFVPVALMGLWRSRKHLGSKLGEQPARTVADASRGKYPVLFPLLAGLIALAALEVGAYGIELLRDQVFPKDNPFVEQRNPAPLFEKTTINGVSIYQRTTFHTLVDSEQRFLAEKPERSMRIFIIGGSAAAGWPYDIGDSNIRGFLREKLQRLFPDTLVEVVLAAGGTYGSHRVATLLEEVITYQPDLVILYSGNNEFLENFAFRRNEPPGILKHLALARLITDVIGQVQTYRPSYDIKNYTLADQVSNRIAFAFGKSSQYRQDPVQFGQLVAHYRYNIERMASICRDRGLRFMILNVPVNLKDWVPNASRHGGGLSEEKYKQWQDHFREGYLAIERADYSVAARHLEEAVRIDDEHAESHYYLGVTSHQLGDLPRAKKSYQKALERDAYSFRVLPQFLKVLDEIASEYAVPLVDIISALEEAAEDGIIGDDVLVDYVHPTRESQEIIAQEIVKTMALAGLFPHEPELSMEAIRLSLPDTFQPFIDAQAIEALYQQSLIMRQYDKVEELYPEYIRIMEQAMANNSSLVPLAQSGLDIVNTIHPIISEYSLLLRAEKLGILEQEYSEKRAREVYMRYVDMIKRFEAPGMSREAFLEQVPSLEYVPGVNPGSSTNGGNKMGSDN